MQSRSSQVLRAIAAWPSDRRLVALVSGPSAHDGRWARRSILAEPGATRTVRVPAGVDERDARASVERELRTVLAARTHSRGSAHSGLIGYLSYDLGRVLEPKATAARDGLGDGAGDDRDWPLAILCACRDAHVFDHETGVWSVVGDPPPLREEPEPPDAPWSVGPFEEVMTRAAYEARVDSCVRRIRDGEIFQANVARRVSAPFSGSARSMARAALAASGAWFGAYLELDEARTLVSMSPELFLAADARSDAPRRVVSRPIKGTRPQDADATELIRSPKDAAELAMIVDLVRNDLGRVADLGSVRVDDARRIETHPTVHHGVAEVSATLAAHVDSVSLLRASFPPGSVTGAPKIRAMRVIDELEPVRRGPYCGAIGLFADDGSIELSVAIRTIALSGRADPLRPGEFEGTLDYWAGCGIVADSDPSAEWEESAAKMEVLRRTLRAAAPDDRAPHAS